MNSDLLDAGGLTAPVHLALEVAFAGWKDSGIRVSAVKHFQVILYLLAQEFRHLDHPVNSDR